MSAPDGLKELRACKICSLVKTKEQFILKGCDNCASLMVHAERSNKDFMNDCTSSSYVGLIALMDPASSWVAKWQCLDGKLTPGVYAISVTGEPPGWAKDALRAKGRRYVNRDRS